MCRKMRVVTIYLCKHSTKPVLADISQQSIQSCRPLVNKQFAFFHGTIHWKQATSCTTIKECLDLIGSTVLRKVFGVHVCVARRQGVF